MAERTSGDTSGETPEERAERQRLAAEAIWQADRDLKAKQIPVKEWVQRVRKRVEASGTHIPRSVILDAIHAGRK